MIILSLLAVAGFLVIVFVKVYNNLIHLEAQAQRAWSNIEVILKQRYDEIPQLVQVVEQYAQFEAGVFEKLAEARQHYGSAQSKNEKIEASAEISLAMKGVLALSENYPELKSNASFLELQKRVAEIEESLADRRESYNDAISIYNARIRQLPDVIIANFMGLQAGEVFRTTVDERMRPDLKMNLPHQMKDSA